MRKLFALLAAPVVAGCLVSQVKSTVGSEPTVRSLQPARALTSDKRISVTARHLSRVESLGMGTAVLSTNDN